jgi:putative transposase
MAVRSFPHVAKRLIPERRDQLWVADLTYVAIKAGFVYLAIVLDAWSRKVVGFAISRTMDVRIVLAALTVAIRDRTPPPGCIHHSDRGAQGGFNWSSQRRAGGMLRWQVDGVRIERCGTS